jgi:hypothetical protein
VLTERTLAIVAVLFVMIGASVVPASGALDQPIGVRPVEFRRLQAWQFVR